MFGFVYSLNVDTHSVQISQKDDILVNNVYFEVHNNTFQNICQHYYF